MTAQPKAFASLSSGLLARKGAARPAMRPQGFGQIGGGVEDLGWNDMGFDPPRPATTETRDEDHDAFGAELPPVPIRNPLSALTPVNSPVHEQQAQIEGRLTVPDDATEEGEEVDETAELYDPETDGEIEPMAHLTHGPVEVPAPLEVPAPVVRLPKARAVRGAKAKAAFTLRLDPDRHLKLRFACALKGRSAQQLVTEAVDRLLAEMPELDAMVAKTRRSD